jgi:hypothetical protein
LRRLIDGQSYGYAPKGRCVQWSGRSASEMPSPLLHKPVRHYTQAVLQHAATRLCRPAGFGLGLVSTAVSFASYAESSVVAGAGARGPGAGPTLYTHRSGQRPTPSAAAVLYGLADCGAGAILLGRQPPLRARSSADLLPLSTLCTEWYFSWIPSGSSQLGGGYLARM